MEHSMSFSVVWPPPDRSIDCVILSPICNYLLLACCVFGNRGLGRLVFRDKMNIVSDLLGCDQVGFTRILENRRPRKFLSGAGCARGLHHHWLTVHQYYGVSDGIVSSWWTCIKFKLAWVIFFNISNENLLIDSFL